MCILARVSTLAIVVLVLVALLVLLFVGGLIGARRRAAATEPQLNERVAAADRALEAARAADRGWDPLVLEEAARVALQEALPDFHYDRLQLVLVDDRPGTEHDRAEMLASGDKGLVRVAVTRHGNAWAAKIVG
jgi:type II secretory pathway pseudopilin PulG